MATVEECHLPQYSLECSETFCLKLWFLKKIYKKTFHVTYMYPFIRAFCERSSDTNNI